jgi:hypothetical protein
MKFHMFIAEELPTNQLQVRICWCALSSPALPAFSRSLVSMARVDSVSIEDRYFKVASK